MASEVTRDLQETIGDALTRVSWLDTILHKVADYLNRRKIHKLEAEIHNLEALLPEIANMRDAVGTRIVALMDRIDEIALEKSRFKASDVLTLGMSYGLRRLWGNWNQRAHEMALAAAYVQIDELTARAADLQTQLDQLNERLEEMQRQANPSWLARVIRWFLALKNMVCGVIGMVTQNLHQALTNWAALARSIPQLRRA